MNNKHEHTSTQENINEMPNTKLVPPEYGNIFKNDYILIMNPTQYLQHIIFEVPKRMVGNHIFLMRKGTAHASFNFKEYEIKANDLILVPDNYIMYIDHFSDDAQPWLVQCNFNTPEEKTLAGIDTTILHLTNEEVTMTENYFNLMYLIATKPTYGPNDFMHLIISMLYWIRELNATQNTVTESRALSHAKQIALEFINMMVMDDVAMININDFAQKIGVSENYLSIVVKRVTGITVKKWIERKTEAVIRMLLAEDKSYSLTEIAELVGYSSSPQVVRFFKRRTGMTPFEFRKAILTEKRLRQL